VRDAQSMERHCVFVFMAYTFILWQQLTGGVRRCWATKPLQIIAEILETFRTAVELRLVRWLNTHADVLPLIKPSLAIFGLKKFLSPTRS